MGEPIEVSIEYPGGEMDNSALVTPLGKDTYRLELDTLYFAEDELPSYGDVIEAVQIAAHTLRFIKVIECTPLKRFEYLLSKDFANSDELETILSTVELLDGHWERIFGGILVIYLPEDSQYDPAEAFKQLS